jgi:hypothetical protein
MEKNIMKFDTFPYCCGIEVLGSFSDDYADDDKSLKEKIASIKYRFRHRPVFNALVATLNANQIKNGWGKALNANGFRALTSFINPNTGNMVSLYYRAPKKKRSR